MSYPHDTNEICRVKDDLLLKNLLEKTRSDKAKVLRLQQVNDYEEWLHRNHNSIISRCSATFHNVTFAPASLVQDAIKEGNKFEVLDCLSKGVSINFNATQGEGMGLLHQACVYDDYIIAQVLIKKGASLDLQDDFGCTPLHICCMWDSLKCAQLLVSNNANANVLDYDGYFAVDLASDNSHLKAMMKKHMQQKLNIGDNQLKPLRNKIQKVMLQDIRQLLEEGSTVDVTSSTGVSLLHIAVTNGYISAARMLLENSANVNASDHQMWTPLHCAAKYGQVKMTRLLLSHYANPHSRTTSGFTPRDLAKNSEIAAMLSNAEDTFLDLDKQRTPSKPKRFSASLLDQNNEEEDIVRVPSRTITAAKVCKRVVMKEKDMITEIADRLQQELKSETYFHPPEITNNSITVPTWQQIIPPPVPPRDDPPQINSPLQKVVKAKKHFSPNQLNNDTLVKAALIIQRAYRCYQKQKNSSTLNGALRILEDYSNSFYEEIVFQNAEDIARESDRKRSFKSYQRNSWSSDLRRNARSDIISRPLSTGALLMPKPPEESSLWISQNTSSHDYPMSVPPDVIPHTVPSKDCWSSMPARKTRRPTKQMSMSSGDNGAFLHSLRKSHIELTKTVKHSLIVSENNHSFNSTPPNSYHRKASLASHRTPNQSTYRMPPLTPTVASLINTAAVTENNSHHSKSNTKVMKPVGNSNFQQEENAYLIADGPDSYRFRSHTTREHRYGSMLSNRGSILRDPRFQTLNHGDNSSTNRHSWTCEDAESSTSFGRTIVQSTSTAVSTSTFEPSSETSPTFTPSSGTSRRNSKQSEKGPPLPPPRAPTTKLSATLDSEKQHGRSASLGAYQSGINDVYFPAYDKNLVIAHDNAPDDELPVVPPALPLYTPQALTQKIKNYPNNHDLPAPPPPDMLLYDTLKNMSHPRKLNLDQGVFDLPPPPPTL